MRRSAQGERIKAQLSGVSAENPGVCRGPCTLRAGLDATYTLDQRQRRRQGREEARYKQINISINTECTISNPSAFLEHPKAFALDPVALPLGPGNRLVDCEDGVTAALEDALPDTWGRMLLVRKARLPRHRQGRPHLLEALGGAGIGALAFAPEGEPPPPDLLPGLPDLARLVDAAAKLEAGAAIDDEDLVLLLNAGSSAGGARPKALVMDGEHPAIAKLPSRNDRVPVVRIDDVPGAQGRHRNGADEGRTRWGKRQPPAAAGTC